MRFEGVDNNFVVKVLYKQLSLSRVGESHAIRMMISSISNVRISINSYKRMFFPPFIDRLLLKCFF